jgi:hypothetical protein
MLDAPLFEVTTPATNAAARRLTTAANVNALLGQSATTDQTVIETIIDQVSAECAGYANLARAPSGAVPTFGQEVVKATWLIASWYRSSRLLLPWRTPITAFGTVVEDGTNLVANTDYRLVDGGVLERISSDYPICWSVGKIIVPYTAGWSLPTGVPAELEGQVIEQVKMRYKARTRDPSLRSEATQDVGSAAYGVIGGDSIGESGLLKSLESALAPFTSFSI